MHIIRTAGWLIAGIYATVPAFWMLVHPFADYWRNRGHQMKRLGLWWLLLWLIAWALEFPFRHSLLYDAKWPWLISAALWVVPSYAYRASVKSFTLNRIIGRHEVDQSRPQELVTTGVYARVRNPLYAAHLCTVLGWAVGTGLAVVYACAAFYFVTLMLMLPREEQELRNRFGQPYRDYEKRVPRLIPKLF